MRSMTGYGEASRQDSAYRYAVSVRSVNQRHLEVHFRLPEELRASEAALRRAIGAQVERGRIEVRVFVESLGERDVRVDIRRRAVTAFHKSISPLLEEGVVEGTLRPVDLLRIPEAVVVELVPTAWTDEHQAELLSVVDEAVGALVVARSAEGDRLAEVLASRLEEMGCCIAEVRARRKVVRDEIFAALKRRVMDVLTDQEVDESRLAQEVALLVEKSDIAEEIDRLQSHVARFDEIMAAGGPMGKQLDFLTQEISRELNTVSAKARDAAMLKHALEAKVICEQLREQVQNVE